MLIKSQAVAQTPTSQDICLLFASSLGAYQHIQPSLECWQAVSTPPDPLQQSPVASWPSQRAFWPKLGSLVGCSSGMQQCTAQMPFYGMLVVIRAPEAVRC